jgi:LmbE family N-acetylglucosaminyl deacetylase
MTLVIVSPHMDDAALSCGELLAANPGSHVVTVFSSGPARVRHLPEWDEQSGFFRPGDNVMQMRRREDEDALASVGAVAHHLDFWDQQYRLGDRLYRPRRAHMALRDVRLRLQAPALLRRVEARLEALVRSLPASMWLAPLGVWHKDHQLTATACLRVARRSPGQHWGVYTDLPYGLELAEDVRAAKERVREHGFGLEPLDMGPGAGTERKRALVKRYASQLPPLGARTEIALAGPERYYRLAPLAGGA